MTYLPDSAQERIRVQAGQFIQIPHRAVTDEGSSKILLCADAGNVSLRQMRENIVCHAAAVGCFLHHEHTSRLAAGRFDGRPVDRGNRPQLQNFGRQPVLL